MSNFELCSTINIYLSHQTSSILICIKVHMDEKCSGYRSTPKKSKRKKLLDRACMNNVSSLFQLPYIEYHIELRSRQHGWWESHTEKNKKPYHHQSLAMRWCDCRLNAFAYPVSAHAHIYMNGYWGTLFPVYYFFFASGLGPCHISFCTFLSQTVWSSSTPKPLRRIWKAYSTNHTMRVTTV